MKKIAIYNIKGGVGKTTTCINLACLLAKKKISTLIWDLDPQGGSSFYFNKQNINDNSHSRLFNRYISIYDVIHSTDNHHIDIISNDSFFSDQFINKASQLTTLNFLNNDLIKITLEQVKDDYDVCLIDCSPGRFMLHENIFKTIDLLLVPNAPSPLSVYCNDKLMESFIGKPQSKYKIFSFYNMVQINKILHRQFVENKNGDQKILNNYIPFYTDIENITLTKRSIFEQSNHSNSIMPYSKLWNEISEKMEWLL
ncbi:MAG: ParA family protein [Chitinophagaceae bacterium]|nr:ParA family protein [Chitinophagaceae bacterium]